MSFKLSESSLDEKLAQLKNAHFRLRVKNALADFSTALDTADTPDELMTVHGKLQKVLLHLIQSQRWAGTESRHDSELAEQIVRDMVFKRRQEIIKTLEN